LYDLRFVDVALKALDYDWEIDATLLLDSLHVDGPSDNQVFNQQLFQSISEDYPEIRDRRKLIEIIKTDPHYNAIQARFAYAITCHKAQGGQWERVFIDQGNIPEDHLDLSYYRWLYTALTRAGKKVYLVNFPH
jgi:exodeoxyribonuclease-5